MKRTENAIDWVCGFFGGAGFPIFLIASATVYLGFLTAGVFWPSGDGLVGNFATDFRVWCFGYDPGAGTMRWSWVWIMLTQPFLLLGIALWFWFDPVKELWVRRKAGFIPPAVAGIFASVMLGGGLLALAYESDDGQVAPFPGERIRTTLAPPEFTLHNQEGKAVSLADYRGKVVVLTAIYATCPTACPMIALQAKRSIDRLDEPLRDEVTILAVSLDPEGDTMEKMAVAAEAYGMSAPRFNFLNGDPDEVNRVLDRLQVARMANEKTGEIDHANLFFLIDRSGTIAYRFNLSERHEEWLVQALRSLVEETAPEVDPVHAAGSTVERMSGG